MTIHLHDDVVRTGVVTELEVFHRGLKKIKKIFAENFTRIFTFFMEKNMCRGSHFPLCESFNLKEILFLNLNHFELFDLGKSLFSSFCIQPQRLDIKILTIIFNASPFSFPFYALLHLCHNNWY